MLSKELYVAKKRYTGKFSSPIIDVNKIHKQTYIHTYKLTYIDTYFGYYDILGWIHYHHNWFTT